MGGLSPEWSFQGGDPAPVGAEDDSVTSLRSSGSTELGEGLCPLQAAQRALDHTLAASCGSCQPPPLAFLVALT